MASSRPDAAPPAEGVLFDMDGVLLDSAPAIEEIWRRWAERHGIDYDSLRTIIPGRRTEEVVELAAPALHPPDEASWIEGTLVRHDGGGPPIEAALELYRRLAPERRAVITSALRETAEARFPILGIEAPEVLVTAESVAEGKPAPDCYLAGAAGLGLAPERCLAIEDAPAGIEAARAAGIRVVALTTSHEAAELSGADLVVAPEELVAAVLPLLAEGARAAEPG